MKRRTIVGVISVLGLIAVFVFQRYDFAGEAGFQFNATLKFIVNRTVRFLLNDLLAIGVIFALFQERKYVVFSLWVQLVGVVFFLIPYFVLKVYFPLYNGPLISHLHRLILNPTLLLLLIPAFYYQKFITQKHDE